MRLARLGVLEPATFSNYVGVYCGIAQPAHFPTLTCSCMDFSRPSATWPTPDYVYATNGYRVMFKLAKEAVFAFLMLAALWPGLGGAKPGRPPWPFMAVGASAALGLLLSASSSGPLFAIMSARAFEFLAIALLAARFATGLPVLGRWLLFVLLLELAFVVVELVFAMPTRGCPRA